MQSVAEPEEVLGEVQSGAWEPLDAEHVVEIGHRESGSAEALTRRTPTSAPRNREWLWTDHCAESRYVAIDQSCAH